MGQPQPRKPAPNMTESDSAFFAQLKDLQRELDSSLAQPMGREGLSADQVKDRLADGLAGYWNALQREHDDQDGAYPAAQSV